MVAGALDVFWTPIYMKKGRPAYMLSVITEEDKKDQLSNIIFEETGTLGIREQAVNRKILKRDFVDLDTDYGMIRFKRIGCDNPELKVEYEEAKRVALREGIALRKVYGDLECFIKSKGGNYE